MGTMIGFKRNALNTTTPLWSLLIQSVNHSLVALSCFSDAVNSKSCLNINIFLYFHKMQKGKRRRTTTCN